MRKIQNLIFEESSSANLRRPLRRMICDMKGERGRSFRSKRKREGYLVGQQKEENRRPLQKLKRMNCQIAQMIVPLVEHFTFKDGLFENDKANPQS